MCVYACVLCVFAWGHAHSGVWVPMEDNRESQSFELEMQCLWVTWLLCSDKNSKPMTEQWVLATIESSLHPNVVFQFKRKRNWVQYDVWVPSVGVEGQTHIPMHGLLISPILVKIMSTHSKAYWLNNFKGSVHILVELIFGRFFFYLTFL